MVSKDQFQLHEVTYDHSDWLVEMQSILESTQGINLFSMAFLHEKMADPLSYPIVAFSRDEMIGAAIAQVISKLDYYLPFDPNIVEELASKKVGSFATAGVRENWQGKGVGTLMARARLEWLRAQKCDVLLGVSWVSGNSYTSDRTFEKIGFRPIKKVEGFYRPHSFKDQFICPRCGQPPCECAAILYRFDFTK